MVLYFYDKLVYLITSHFYKYFTEFYHYEIDLQYIIGFIWRIISNKRLVIYLLNVYTYIFALKWAIFREMAGYVQGIIDALRLHRINCGGLE